MKFSIVALNIVFAVLVISSVVELHRKTLIIRHNRAAISSHTKPWPNRTIPYTFQFWNSTENDKDIARIEAGMISWSNVTCVQFRLHNATLSNELHVRIFNERYCSSRVGYQPDHFPHPVQHLYLAKDKNCLLRGNILHQLGHLIGLLNEHQRIDRDKYVEVDLTNLTDEKKRNFQINRENNVLQSSYDPRSIMHYGSHIFSNDPRQRPTLQIRFSNETYHAGELSWKDLSFHDVNVVNKYYKCDASCSDTLPPCSGNAYRDKYCRCVTEKSFNEERCNDLWRNCSKLALQNKCFDDVDNMYINCRRSCNWCHTFPHLYNVPLKKEICDDRSQKAFCASLAVNGECRKSRRWMYRNCAKACGRCAHHEALDKLNSNSTCRDTWNFVDCDAWASTGECYNNPTWMNLACRRSCNLCVDFKKLIITVKPEALSSRNKSQCNDKRITCQYWTSLGLCHRRTELMRNNCAFSCGLCDQLNVPTTALSTTALSTTTIATTMVFTTPDPHKLCINVLIDKECENFAKAGQCANETIYQVCHRSCRPECFRRCRNRYYDDELCDKLARDGFCLTNAWVRDSCSQSCGTCPPPLIPCRDLRSSCPRRCVSLKDYRECRHSCGLCDIQCKDKLNHCEELRQSRWCTLFSVSTSRGCMHTCGLCTPSQIDIAN